MLVVKSLIPVLVPLETKLLLLVGTMKEGADVVLPECGTRATTAPTKDKRIIPNTTSTRATFAIAAFVSVPVYAKAKLRTESKSSKTIIEEKMRRI